MKKWLVFSILMLLFSNANYAQELLMDTEDVHASDVLEAKFNGGGIEKFSEYINGNFNYMKVKKAGTVVASFTIDLDGKLKNIKLTQFIDAESAGEMFRVLNNCPKWEPAKRAGKPISIQISYPMVFKYN